MSRNQVHELNRNHIAAGVADSLAGLRPELWRRFRAELAHWRPRPLYATVFGSAARSDGDESSDIDLLLVHPPLPGEKKPTRMSSALRSQIAEALGDFVLSSGEADATQKWEDQVDRLRELTQAWTGNALQVVDMPFHEWRRPAEQSRRLLAEVERDGVELVKSRAFAMWSSSEGSHRG